MDNKDNYKQILVLITTATEACVIIRNLSEASPHYPKERGKMWTHEVSFAMGDVRTSGIRLNQQG